MPMAGGILTHRLVNAGNFRVRVRLVVFRQSQQITMPALSELCVEATSDQSGLGTFHFGKKLFSLYLGSQNISRLSWLWAVKQLVY